MAQASTGGGGKSYKLPPKDKGIMATIAKPANKKTSTSVAKKATTPAKSTASSAKKKTYTGTQVADSGFKQYQRAQASAQKTVATPAKTTKTTTSAPKQTYSSSGGTASVKQSYATASKAPTSGGTSINLAPTAAKTSTPAKAPTPTQLSWLDVINKSTAGANYAGALTGQRTRLLYNGKVMDTDNAQWIKDALSNGAKIVKSNSVTGENLDLQKLSMAALSGDKSAQEFLKKYNISKASGSALWKGQNVTKEMFDASGQDFRAQYVKDNPYADVTKQYEMNNYNAMSEWIKSGKPIADYQMESYNNLVNKWNLDDMNDPFVQYQQDLKKNQQDALSAQDVALNQGMAQMDANSFQQMQGLQQNMSERGISDSGLASDAYMRAQMANNMNYQQAYAEGATRKADITQQYTDAIQGAKVDSMTYKDQKAQAEAENMVAQQNALAKLQEQQTEQDKYLTSSTGYVYLNGQVMKGANGQPMTSLEYAKLQETNRHNTATESISMQKMNNDLAVATQKLQYNWASLDLKSQVAQADIADAQAKLEIMARNADTTAIKAQAGILNNQLKNIQTQINGYKKADKPVPDSLKTQLKDIMTKMSTLANMGK